MLIKAGFRMRYALPQPTPMLAMLHIHRDREHDLKQADQLIVEPGVRVRTYTDNFGNTCSRFLAPAGQITLRSDAVVLDSGQPDDFAPLASPVPIDQLDPAVMPFLLQSRYCDSDLLAPFAWQQFGNIEPGWAQVQAICDFAHNHLEFGYHHASLQRTASMALQDKRGVCRDFAHLAIALCRAINIPARYCSGYLGDIGVPRDPAPMDFSAWFEVYLDGRWFSFDARHNMPRIGRIVMTRGRDAADTTLVMTFGPHILEQFEVYTDEIVEADGPAIVQQAGSRSFFGGHGMAAE